VSFNLLIDLATKPISQLLHVVSEDKPKIPTSDFTKIDDLKEAWSETFLDNVFGPASKLKRDEFEKKVATSEKWLFSSKTVRAKVEKELNL
jgi:hypothetical protein